MSELRQVPGPTVYLHFGAEYVQLGHDDSQVAQDVLINEAGVPFKLNVFFRLCNRCVYLHIFDFGGSFDILCHI